VIRRILIVFVLAVAVIAVVGDRLAVSAAQRAVSIKVRDAALLGANPTVKITGFPFLTQAVRGRYDKIDVTAHDIHRDGVRIDTIRATFYGVHVGLSAALAGRVNAVPIDRSTGSILLTFADLDSYLAKRHLTVTDRGGALQVEGSLTIAGHALAVSGTYAVSVDGRKLVLSPVASSLRAAGVALSGTVASAVTSALAVSIDTGTLPFGLTISKAVVLPTGIGVDATARGLVVPVPADASSVPPSS
jgi:hypothetical protein